MSDTATPGQRLDDAIADVRKAADELRAAAQTKGAEIGEQVSAGIDALSASIDELQAAWAERSA